MFSIQPQQKSSYLATKKNQLRKQIRRQQLDNYFSSKRKLKLQQDITQNQKQKYLQNFGEFLQQFLNSQSNEQAQTHIKTIFDELTRDNVDFETAILLQPQKLIKLFILFPQNRYSVQIFHMMVEYCYDQTFGLDDQKFVAIHTENSFEVIIERKQMTEYQQALEILMKTIHEMIPELHNRILIQNLTSLKEMEEANQNNKRIQKRLKMYLFILGRLSIRENSFIMRYEYVEKYLSIWSKCLLVDYDFCKGQILRYINLVSKFVIPFQSLSKYAWKHISQYQYEADELIVFRLFELCVPQGERQILDNDKHDVLAISIIQPLFSYAQLRIDMVVKFFDQIARLLRVVLLKRQHFKISMVTKMFHLIYNVIYRIVEEANDQNSTVHDSKVIKSINVLEMVKEMEFLQTFSFYLCYEQWAHASIFRILCALIEYCIVFNHQIEQVIGYKNLFIEICHKISHNDREIMNTNLKSLGIICRYAQVCGKNKIFSTMVQNGVCDTLQNLAHGFLDQFVGNQAIELLDLYFKEEQVQEYVRIEQEREKLNQRDEFEIPNRKEMYDD